MQYGYKEYLANVETKKTQLISLIGCREKDKKSGGIKIVMPKGKIKRHPQEMWAMSLENDIN